MKIRNMPPSWTLRFSNVRLPAAPAPRPAAASASRPGIATRWKPRDRVSAGS